MIHLLTVSGSLRARSTSDAVSGAIARLAPADVIVTAFARLRWLPHFDPDIEEAGLPDEPAAWRQAVGACDGLLIVSPEYAHGVPGSLKNALDWLVGGHELVGKPVAVINPSARSQFAHPQLLETLRTMAGRVIDAASVTLPFGIVPTEPATLATDATYGPVLRDALAAFVAAISRERGA